MYVNTIGLHLISAKKTLKTSKLKKIIGGKQFKCLLIRIDDLQYISTGNYGFKYGKGLNEQKIYFTVHTSKRFTHTYVGICDASCLSFLKIKHV